jgi:crotonobetainyl-CoA:carnitine CoA-transferase CaiB-like acyl-CoA transferase
VAQSDVLVENFSPRVMPNFGLDARVLAGVNPALISLAMPAFASTGPWSGYVAYGGGLELATGLAHVDAAGRPVAARVPYLDYLAGALGAAGVLAALLARDAAGTGCHIELAQREVAGQVLAASFGSSGWRYGDVDAAAFAADPALRVSGLLAPPEERAGTCVHFGRPPWRIAELPQPQERPAPVLGLDSRMVLRAAGIPDAAIDRLVVAEVVHDAATGAALGNISATAGVGRR